MKRPLAGLKIGISISETEDMVDFGLRNADIAPLTVAIAKRLISLGAGVVLGHQWRPNGIIDSIVRFTQIYRSESTAPQEPIVYSLLAAPDTAQISLKDRKELESVLSIEDAISAPDIETVNRENQRLLDLRQMRRQMAKFCHARICIGGKKAQKNGRSHGVIEEAALTAMLKDGRDRPVFFCGLLKGTAGLLIDLLRERQDVEDVRKALSLERGKARNGQTDCNDDTWKYLGEIASINLRGFERLAGLKTEEQDALFDAQSIDTIIAIVSRSRAPLPREE